MAFLNKFLKVRYKLSYKAGFVFGAIFILSFAGVPVLGASGVPQIISYQGRLTDSSSNLLGGTGTTYYFKFSFWDSPSTGAGSKLWPSATSGIVSATVTSGVFNVNIGDTGSGYPDALNYDFLTSSDTYLQIEVSPDGATFETLSPRQRIDSAGFALNAQNVSGNLVASSTADHTFNALNNGAGRANLNIQNGSLLFGGAVKIDYLGQGNFATTTISALTVSGTTTLGNLDGLLKGTSGAVGAAIAGVDYLATSTGNWLGTFQNKNATDFLSSSTLYVATTTGDWLGTLQGYSPSYFAPSSTVSSQWITTGSNIYYNTGSVGIGNISPSYALDVTGDIRGTTGIRLGSAANYGYIFPFDGTSPTIVNASGKNISFYSYSIAANNIGTAFVGENIGITSGNYTGTQYARTFNPTSGAGTFINLDVKPIINQTGGANGITRGIYINPTLTVAADWRSLEMTNNGGFGIYQSGASSTNYFAGNIGVGTSTPVSKLDILDTALSNSGSLAGSVLNIAQTWNTSGTPVGVKIAITDTASGAASKPFQVLGGAAGTTNLFSVDRTGQVTINSALTAGNIAGSSLRMGTGRFSPGAADGRVRLLDVATNATFSRLTLGLETSVFPALSVTSAATPTLNVVAGDGTSASNLYISGNVGIGTSTPGSKLDVASSFSASSGIDYGVKIITTYNQTGTAGGTDLLIDRTSTAVGSGEQNFIDFKLGGTSRFRVTAATNGRTWWGTGAYVDSSQVYFANGYFGNIGSTASNSSLTFQNGNFSTANRFAVTLGSGTHSQTSGTNGALTIVPVYNQVSTSTAANTDLLIKRTETSLGTGVQYLIDTQVGTSSKFSVSNTGQGYFSVGLSIGTSTPFATTTALTVCALTNCTLSTASSAVMFLASDTGLTTGVSLVARGSISGGNADMGEYVDVVGSDSDYNAGDILSVSANNPGKFEKSGKSFDKNLAGAVTETAGFIAGGGAAHGSTIIALVGRVPVKVSAENGPIKVGDYITSAGEKGYGMRADKAGRVLGQALTAFDGSVATGTVTVFVHPGYFNGSSLGTLLSGLFIENGQYTNGSSTVFSEIDFAKNILGELISRSSSTDSSAANINRSEVFVDRLSAGLEIITPQIYAKGLLVDRIDAMDTAISFMNDAIFFGRPYFNSDTGGFAVVSTGARSVDIVFEKQYMDEPVVNATMVFDADSPENSADNAFLNEVKYAVTNSTAKGFTIYLNRSAPANIKFNWMAIAIKNAKLFSSISTDPPLPVPAVNPPVEPGGGIPPPADISSSTVPSAENSTTTDSGQGSTAPEDPVLPPQTPPAADDGGSSTPTGDTPSEPVVGDVEPVSDPVLPADTPAPAEPPVPPVPVSTEDIPAAQ
ncbi:MAG: Cell wall surface anchor family protein [Parcubacteria group bacterium LiPW_15]|nr:MAG: Cell wall surface anchor family protein [Parcubacteria group bacterium LiPW_15]